MIETADHFEPWMLGVEIQPEAFVTGLDLVRGDDGELLVLEDNTRTPSGLVYAAAARAAVAEQLPCGDGVLDPEGAFELLGADHPRRRARRRSEHRAALRRARKRRLVRAWRDRPAARASRWSSPPT